MACDSCFAARLRYQVRFEGEENERMLPILAEHFRMLQQPVQQIGNRLTVPEEAMAELFDFCNEHMNLAAIFYRIENGEWEPLRNIPSVLESQWIDDVIKLERITPFFQPIVDAQEQIFGHEILSRSFRDDGTLIPPIELFSSARKRNRLYALDKLCRLTAVKQAPKLGNQKMFINFLPTSIYSPEHCLKTTLEMSRKTGANPAHFVFEVVESEKVDDLEHLKAILRFYREHGFEYALDDVGEGYSTLDVLRELKPAYMKLDRKYVHGIATDPLKQRMANKIIQVAREIQSIPLAEGIEDRRDFECVRGMGYQLFQGYHFGKPAEQPVQSLHA
ncbi:MAG: EAL domain-containing protein [Clostridia bacterium]